MMLTTAKRVGDSTDKDEYEQDQKLENNEYDDSSCRDDDGSEIEVSPESRKTKEQSNEEEQQLSQKETKNVHRLKLGMITILTLSAIAAGVLSFWYLRRTEYLKFEGMFDDDASKLGLSLYANVMTTFGSLELLATTMITHADAANETWPLSTIPHFGNVASKVLSMSAAINLWNVISINGTQERLQWEEYAWQRRSFVNETIQIMETDPTYSGEMPWNIPMKKQIHDDHDTLPYNVS
jgi:hypothetical protein